MAKTEVEVVVKGTDKASGVMRKIGKNARALGIGLTAIGTAAIGMGVVAVAQFAAAGDEIQKMALRINFSTESLSEYKHALELSGAGLETLEKASKKLSKAIIDADDGLATYQKAFDKLGLSTEDLLKLKPEEQFNVVSQALARLENETVKVALAQDLFGRAGTQLLPMLAEGAEGIAAMRQEAHDLGLVFSQEAADSAAAFNDALTKLKGSVKGVMMEVGGFLVDALKPLVDMITVLIKEIVAWAKEHPGLAKVITLTSIAMGGLLVVLGGLLLILGPLIAGWKLLAAIKWSTVIPAIWAHVTALWAQVTATLAAMAATGVLIPVAIAAVAAIATLATGVALLVKNQREQYDSTNAVTGATDGLTEATTAYGDAATTAFDSVSDSINGVVGATQELTGAQRDLAGKAHLALVELAQQRGLSPFEQRQLELFGERIGIKRPSLPEVPFFGELFQHGGIVTSPTRALIGEAGPEAVIPLGDGIPLENNINLTVLLDGQVVGRILNRYSGEAYLIRSHMRG